MKLDLELSFLALEVLSLIIIGEVYGNSELLADLVTFNLLLKAGDKVARAEREAIAFCLAALKSFAVNKALKVDHCSIAILSGSALDLNKS